MYLLIDLCNSLLVVLHIGKTKYWLDFQHCVVKWWHSACWSLWEWTGYLCSCDWKVSEYCWCQVLLPCTLVFLPQTNYLYNAAYSTMFLCEVTYFTTILHSHVSMLWGECNVNILIILFWSNKGLPVASVLTVLKLVCTCLNISLDELDLLNCTFWSVKFSSASFIKCLCCQ